MQLDTRLHNQVTPAGDKEKLKCVLVCQGRSK